MEIEAFIKPRVKKSVIGIKFNLIFYSIIALACFIILLLNSVFYITNPVILMINAIGIMLSAYFVYYGRYSFQQLRETEGGIQDLAVELRKKIDFYNRIYERWTWFIPTVTLILIFSINTLIDNQNGTFKINKPFLFAGINVAIFFGIYLINKITHEFWLKDIKSYLKDIDNQLMEETLDIESRKKKLTWWIFLIFLILTAMFIWGITRAI